ncbi:beta-ketoacyl-ACP synthase II [Campylobacter jejuni]|uniref:3-oxoacyl-[acyl-carrier-protein] synthase 2 n=2 Tax=Campylobacter jejuni TaxID=197 RepID=A0AAD2Z503_CAMJU|nr:MULTISPECIES: beta-ketoacyl-ACP synthase II [Campylobacter]ADT65808.1 3-oxoacyl-(acyl-carrier-protein) synthase II [Campylobacter jejuni subsp. jejuni ICDCCJ07001]EAK5450915.1 beta-ketoacyl-ACP synthase II [Campylobacter hyointestinalis]ETN90671.1 3-oxoacyl-ACP synthase [Campylobacter jejuni subsp. jejuni 81-176-UMCW9]ALF91487.1 beta-ketoacyl-[acp] synthase II (KASII) [Campylobacter jejuni subsp. jejuni]ALF93121.1 beta-ketoacyl-[acp] synthase II (KASII) [Campylobacter jejuni subsp. jejuni]
MKRVVVTGIGMINALGLDKESSFKAICNGESGVNKITLFDATDFPVQIAAEVKNFDPLEVVDGKEVKKIDRFIQLGIKAAREAMQDAGFNEELDKEEFGIVSAAGIGGLPNIEKNSIICSERGPRKISPFFIPSALVNMLGGLISIEHGLKGPNISCVTACAAGTHAIGEAYKSIALGNAKKMLVIGAEAAICPVGIGGFASMKALSTRNEDPQHASRPFDKERDGFVMGEGAGALVFEEYEEAKKRGATIYAELIGFGESADAHHITSPTLDGPLRAMKKALNMAGNPKVDYINAHGTSTPVNDKNETAAIKELFGNNIPLISSTKGQTGHCLGAAGAIEAVVSVMALRDGVVPPTINQLVKDDECDLDYVPNISRKVDLKVVMSNSFGFGGTNGCVVFKKVD